MKVLQIASYCKPEALASPYLNENLREDIVKSGMEMTVLVPCPSRDIPDDVRKVYKKKKEETFYDGKLLIHRFSLMKERKNPILRAIRYFVQCLKQFYYVRYTQIGRDCDVLLSSSTPPILPSMVSYLSHVTGKPFVYDLQDIFPDSLVGTGLVKKGSLLYKIGNVIANYGFKHADKIIVIGEDFKKNIINKGVPAEKIEVVYNWIDESVVVPVKKEDNPLFKEFEINQSKFNVVYAGNLGNAQNIDVIIDSAKVLSDTHNINFLIFGTGGLKDKYIAKVKKEGLNNVRFFPLQPIERVSYVYGLGDVCIVSCKPGLGGAAMPSKTWTIMACGRPVIANFDEGELKEIIEKNNCGVFSHAGNVKEFVAAIKLLAANREKCEDMGKNGRQFILDNLTREVGTKKIVDIIKSVIGER